MDESLFGTTTSARRRVHAQQASVVSQAVLEKLKQDPKAVYPQANAVVLSPDELERMQKNAMPRNRMSAAERSGSIDSRKQRALERKARMKKLDEVRKNQKKDLSDLQLEDMKAAQAVLEKAARVRIESHDQVKNMNQMLLYAKCVAIRDKQLDEKKVLVKKRRAEEERLDAIMEEKRVVGVELALVREREREEERKAGAAVIVEQMEHNQRVRVLEEEKKKQEGMKMVQRIKDQEERDRLEKFAAQQRAKNVLAEVLKANAAQTEAKKALVLREKEEDNRIAMYLKDKDRRAREAEARLEEIKAQKEREIALMRAKQEKACDAQAEEDALRARRAQEKAERRWRANEVKKLEAKKAQISDLQQARESQRMQKERRMKSMAREEKRVFNRMVHAFKKDAAERAQVEELAHNTRILAKDELLKQIDTKEQMRKQEKDVLMKESERMKREVEVELKKLALIKQDKLKQLEAQAVPKKYRAELARKKIIIS